MIFKSLKDVCQIIAGQSPEGKYYNSDGKGLPFYQGKKEFTDKFIGAPTTWTTMVTKEAIEGDVLMSVRAPVGPVNFSTQRICIGRGLAAIRASDKINNDYLFYFLLKHESEIESNEGAVFNSINKTQIGNINIYLPPLPEQKQIVQILDKAFAAIDQAKANIEKNIQNAQELFQSKLNEIFSQKGEGWEEKRLGDESLIKIIDGDRGVNYPKKMDFLPIGHCVFMNTGNVRPDGFDFTNVVFITKEKDEILRKGKLQREDVVMTTRGTIGNVGWYNSQVKFENIRINSGMLIFRVNRTKILPEYLFTILRSPIVTKQIQEKTTGAAQPQLPIKTLVSFKIPVNSLTEQTKIIKLISKIEETQKKLISLYGTKAEVLEELKKSILQKAFSGELTSQYTEDFNELSLAAEPKESYGNN